MGIRRAKSLHSCQIAGHDLWPFRRISGTASFNSVEEIFDEAGITINGNKPYDIRIKNDRFYKRIMRDGSLGLGESYMDGWWDAESLDEFIFKLMPTDPQDKVKRNLKLVILSLVLNMNRKSKAFRIGEQHYDLGNDLFGLMLDKRMMYSCGYWKEARTLDDSQEAKIDLICRKIGLKPGDRILDIGCGWGGFVKYTAEKHGVKAVGITVSKNQAEFARYICNGLPVEIRLQDYRDIDEKFDHIVSIGMFEHVGHKNYRTYMQTVHKCLKDDGLFLLHTIGDSYTKTAMEPWMDKYIFPNSLIPSTKQISAAAEKLFVIEDWHNFGFYYDRTLMSWFGNFDRNWPELKSRYDDRFYRMWKYYLLSCAGTFRSRCQHLWQIVLSKKGVPGGYESVR